jgi:steroid delta-isomerase-like uncharacterized protein
MLSMSITPFPVPGGARDTTEAGGGDAPPSPEQAYLLCRKFMYRRPRMSLDDNKELVRRFYRDAINERDLDAVDRLLTEDFTHDGELKGHEGQRQAVAYFLDAFPDLRNEIELLVAEGDLVAAHQRWSGTHKGPFLGIDATGKTVEFTSTAVLRIRDGLIAEAWDEVDMMSVLQQLS